MVEEGISQGEEHAAWSCRDSTPKQRPASPKRPLLLTSQLQVYPSTCIFCLGEGTTFPVTWTENYGTLPEPQLPYWFGWGDSWGWKTVFQSNYQWLSRGYQGRPWTRGLTWCPVTLTVPYEVSSYNSHVADNENRAFVYVKEFWGYWGAQNITCLRIHS